MWKLCPILVVLILTMASSAKSEYLKQIIVTTDNCFSCGVIEEFGQLDIKVCGLSDCCFTQHLDNDDYPDFMPGAVDVFEDPVILGQCFGFLLSSNKLEKEGPPVSVTVFHEGSDGIQLVDIKLRTDKGLMSCPINAKLDDYEYISSPCSYI